MLNNETHSIGFRLASIFYGIMITSLCGCSGAVGGSRASSSPLFDEMNIVSIPAEANVRRYDQCHASVSFNGVPRLMSSVEIDQIKKSSGIGRFVGGHIYEMGNYSEGAVCGCYNTDVALENTNNYDLEKKFAGIAEGKSSRTFQISIFKKEPEKKYVDFQHSFLTEFGEISEKIRSIYSGNCQFMAMTWARAMHDDGNSASRFLSSVSKPQAPSNPPSAVSQLSGDAVQRLRSLKNLLDQKFITSAEYEVKRKAILDDL